MRILWTLPYLPWPLTSAGKIRQYQLLRSLAARGHSITLLIQAKTELDAAARNALEPLVERLIVLPRRPLSHPFTLLGGLCAPWPLRASINGLSPLLRQTFATLLQERWDAVHIEHSYSFQPYARLLNQAKQPFLLEERSLDSSPQWTIHEQFPDWLDLFRHYDQWRARRWKRNVLNRANQVITVSEQDAIHLRRLTARPLHVVINGVDTQTFAHVQPDATSQRVLLVGNYQYAEYREAVEWTLNDIFPLLWRLNPKTRLALCGYGMPLDWPRRWPDPRIEWLGFVPDLRELQARSAVFLMPLRQHCGSNLKVLEALAAGLPLVSTAQGILGLALAQRRHYRGGEDAQTLAESLYALLHHPLEAQRLGEAGREYVSQHHDWRAAAEQLEQVYLALQPEEAAAPEVLA